MTIRRDFSLSKVLWYKIGGIARYLLEAQNKEDVFRALDFVEKNHIKKIFVIGQGSNLLFSDDYFDGVVIRIISENLSQRSHLEYSKGATLKNGLVQTFAGEILDDLIQFCFDNNLIGLEWAGGLPGMVGAGVRGNVGAFGGEIKDLFEEAEILELFDGKFDVKKVKKPDMNFSYRNSTVKQDKNLLLLSASFKFERVGSQKLTRAREVYHSNIKYREENHPLEYPNCGSVFKNIVKKEDVDEIISVWPDIREKSKKDWYGKIAMGYVIKRLGFSGFQKGHAQVSQKHSNFIVNLGGARAADVLSIIKVIQEKFLETFNFIPEVEVEIVD